ncbi:hypothetical protein H6775_01015 [Candidatus Nomurabacteria bacterium]|nr:hypothetical protein [Candidatus Nomurabacteria bacterium]
MTKRILVILLIIFISTSLFIGEAKASSFDLDTSEYTEDQLQDLVNQLQKQVNKALKNSGRSSKNVFLKTKKQLKDEQRTGTLVNATSSSQQVSIDELEKKILEIQKMVADFIASFLGK